MLPPKQIFRKDKIVRKNRMGSISLQNVDPDFVTEKFSELYNNKCDCNEKAQAAREHAKEFLAELIGVKKITRKIYIAL